MLSNQTKSSRKKSYCCRFEVWACLEEANNIDRVAVISAKNHKRQRRKRQTRKVANAKGLNRNTNLT